MLLSPGRSPREISSPSPSVAASPSPSTQTLTTTTTSASVSISRKRHRPTVLDEDTYVAAIEKIVERDFFPDLPKLRDRLDWLEAIRTGDPVVIRDAQLKILERRSSAKTQTQTQTPLDSARSRSASLFPSFTPTPSNPNYTEKNQTLPSQDGEIDLSFSLDDFLSRYTSEDNESFTKIIEKVNQKKREKYAHLLEGEKEKVEAIEYDKRDRITDGFGTSDQPPSTLEGAKFTAKNLLMYPADKGEVPLTPEEQAERLKGLTKEINRSNTRFNSKSLSDSVPLKEDEAATILYTTVAGSTPAGPVPRDSDKFKKYDLEDLRKTPNPNPFYIESDKKADNGYSFVKTPSPAPGVDESPFMTWGEIDGTPLRLDLDDDALGTPGSANGPQFKIPMPAARDVKAHLLSREAARKIKERRNKFAPKPPLPSPSRSGSMSPGVRTLSPAAQKFVRNAMAKSSRTIDETLRASYRGGTPVAGTPRTRSRFSRDVSTGLRSPSAQNGSASPW
ncbi:Protein DGCR14 [Rhynchospora pubera]|uniref:Protein DGCR14 n=1 Tax=Rhynchospora pubera TaxID=906938 RepID=A0AAV8DQ91_9POAL|nr:Protein DGCR14 [Rhynchospora pubera]